MNAKEIKILEKALSILKESHHPEIDWTRGGLKNIIKEYKLTKNGNSELEEILIAFSLHVVNSPEDSDIDELVISFIEDLKQSNPPIKEQEKECKHSMIVNRKTMNSMICSKDCGYEIKEQEKESCENCKFDYNIDFKTRCKDCYYGAKFQPKKELKDKEEPTPKK